MVGQVAAGVQNNARTTTTAEIGARIATVSASNGGRAFNSDGAVVQKHHAGAPAPAAAAAAAAAGKRAIAIAIAAIAAMNISRHGNCRVHLFITHAIATSAAAAIASVQKAAAIASIATIEGRGNIASNDIAVTTTAAATTTATGAAVVTISTVWNGLRAGRPTGPCIRTVARDAGVTCIATIATVAVYVTITAPASGRTIKSLCMRRRRQDDWQQQRPRERRGAQKYKRACERATIANCHGIPPVCRKQRFRGRPDRRTSRENHRLPLRRVACVRHAHRPTASSQSARRNHQDDRGR
ncbi:hypothetical protein P3C58_24385 [Mesorhizobium sp. XAP10]|uniref:hypothetical protein n=1 Tax=unclassified Mesorhizobium TaxID=325217 RepID=UPI0023DFDEBC|nr:MULTISPECIES: hypothetical protein [unclassified Mesorhizobium]MDF3155121.1 hypothetical protein [Mesorhizobium sp. XAP10]MDF3248002.1 hypothetical protein [Mesorhizobium sp. XAP4]